MKDGRTHLAYKPEHAVYLDTGAVVAAAMHPADQGDTTTMPDTLGRARWRVRPRTWPPPMRHRHRTTRLSWWPTKATIPARV